MDFSYFENGSDYDIGDGIIDDHYYPGDIEELRNAWVFAPQFIPTMVISAFAFLIGVVGNILVILTVMRDKKKRSVTTSFMVSLACADILFLCVCVPYQAIQHVLIHWALGPILCKVSEFIEMLSAVASILNLSSVSVER